jgi:dienelactone hydrolase
MEGRHIHWENLQPRLRRTVGVGNDGGGHPLPQGFAVITPDFPSRDENKSGCPGGTGDEMLKMAGQRSREGIYQAINPARLAARGQDITTVVRWLKERTALPILIAGHSEGRRATYALYITDPQIVGGMCVKQGLQGDYEHTWRWNTRVPMWQSLEENDPWVVPRGATVRDVTFERKFVANPQNLTVVIVPGKTHDPLVQEAERASLAAWLNQRVPQRIVPGQNGFDYEAALPEVQQRLK